MKILLIEDNRETADYIFQGLQEKGHVASVSQDGREGLFRAASENWDMLIVDRLLPGMDGLSLVHTLRGGGVHTPVLFLTALGGIDDRVEGLNAGADDYLVKPFAFSELLARVVALTRRPPLSSGQTVLRIADVEMDLLKRSVTRSGVAIDLQPREFMLLEFLMRHAGHIVTRTMLLEGVWDFHFDPKTNIVETNMSRLRAKLHRE